MKYDKELVTHKLYRWEQYLKQYKLPEWKDLPDIGLYMDQVIALLTHYLDFISSGNPEEKPITPTTINNYVRLRVMPPPVKRKYYRVHIAYLIVIFTLKQSVSISSVQKVIPASLSPEEVRSFYESYCQTMGAVAQFFTIQTKEACEGILSPDSSEVDEATIDSLIIQTMLTAGFSGLLAEKLLQLQGASREEILSREQSREG
jgi:hypothetical protein